MSALRLARGFTQPRPHPQVRRLLPRPRRRAARERRLRPRDARRSRRRPACRPASPPTRSSARTTTSTAVAAAVARYGEGLAAIIVEPVAGNMGVVPPAPGFLEALRALCDASGALLVFDEVITGFRVARGGAQERFGVTPDLTILGKIVGGGLPLAAFGGRADVMDAARAGRRRLPGGHALREPARDRGRALGAAAAARPGRLRRARARAARGSRTGSRRSAACSASARCSRSSADGAGAQLRATRSAATPSATARSSATCSSAAIYVAPSQFEAMFLSLAHGDDEIDRTVEAVGDFFGR